MEATATPAEATTNVTMEAAQKMAADAATAAVEQTIARLSKSPDAPPSLKELGGDPEARALLQLQKFHRQHRNGEINFDLAAARSFLASLPPCELTKVWLSHHNRAPREKGSMYPVRQFGSAVVSLFPDSDSHHTKHVPQYE